MHSLVMLGLLLGRRVRADVVFHLDKGSADTEGKKGRCEVPAVDKEGQKISSRLASHP